jgi:hypothetical protein
MKKEKFYMILVLNVKILRFIVKNPEAESAGRQSQKNIAPSLVRGGD